MSETTEEYMERIDCETVDDYMKYLNEKWPMDDVIEVDGHLVSHPVSKAKS